MTGRASAGCRIGVVVVSYNTPRLLAECLSSLSAEIRAADLDASVWVVDNASSDDSAAVARRHAPPVTLIELERNLGYAAAANIALRAFLGEAGAGAAVPAPDMALVLNPDVTFRPGALAALVVALAGHPDAALAGPAMEYPDGSFQHAAFRFPGLAQTVLDLWPMARLADSAWNGRYPRRLYAAGTPFDVDFTLGACMLVRLSAVRQIGLMDEGYFLYCEEVDWCRRFRFGGYRCLCVPASVAVHHAAASTSAAPGARDRLWQSRVRYFSIHERRWRSALLRALIRSGRRARARSQPP